MSVHQSTKTPNPQATIFLASIQAGERVTVYIRPIDGDSTSETWYGTVLAVDVLGLRLQAEASRIESLSVDPTTGVWFWPWGSIDSIEVREVGR